MPCCIGIIDYAQCRHSTLYKLGCTAGCEELCASAQQEVLLRTRFRWRCEECHALRYAADADARTDRWNDQARRIIAKDKGGCGGADHGLDASGESAGARGRAKTADAGDARRMRVLALRDREEFEEQLQEQRRLAQVEEIQYAEEWTSQYGRAVFAVRYGSRGRRQQQRRRQRGLRRDGEQTADNDDDGEAAVTARRPRTQDTPGANDHLRLRHSSGQQQQASEGINDDDDGHAAARQVEKLRSVQQWDLDILRDALRTDEELRALRAEARRLVQGEGDDTGPCGAGFGFGARRGRVADDVGA